MEAGILPGMGVKTPIPALQRECGLIFKPSLGESITPVVVARVVGERLSGGKKRNRRLFGAAVGDKMAFYSQTADDHLNAFRY